MKRADLIKMIDELAKGIAIHQHHEKRISMEKDSFKFSRKWYQAHFDVKHYFEVDAWCSQQFGPHPARPDAWSRWWHKFEDSILFRDQDDYMMFVLRWGRT
jgi:hypothetical protein